MNFKINIISLCLFSSMLFSSNTDIYHIWDKCIYSNAKEYKLKYKLPNIKKQLIDLKKTFIHHFKYDKQTGLIKKNLKHKQIPKIIHQIWVGTRPIPKLYQRISKTWEKFHPTWKYKLWTDKEVSKLNLYNKKIYYSIVDPRERADILRYELLEKFGGLYVDMDFECIKPLDLIHEASEMYAGICPNDVKEILLANGLIGSISNHPIIKRCVREIKVNRNLSSVIRRTGPRYFQKQFFILLINQILRDQL